MKEIVSMFTSREFFVGVVSGLTSSILIWFWVKVFRLFKENDIKSLLTVIGFLILVLVAPIVLSVLALKFLSGFLLWLVLIILGMVFIGGIAGIAITIVTSNDAIEAVPDDKLK